MRFLPVSLNALIVELDNLQQTLVLLDSLHAEPLPGVEECIPAARTILIYFHPEETSPEAIAGALRGRDLTRSSRGAGRLVEIPVLYNGEDLGEVAELLDISVEELIRRHTGSEYIVAFTGFSPGFAYLTGGHPSLDVPRRKTPRTRLPAGSVGLAGTFSGVYPQASPGGWQIIGITEARMWDLSRPVPALLQPGFRVHFVDAGRGHVRAGAGQQDAASTRTSPTAAEAAPSASVCAGDAASPRAAAAVLEVQAVGIQVLFQDRGRIGKAGQGVSRSGALDQGAFRAANRLVGNAPDTPCLEVVNGGLHCVCRGEAVMAVTGAPAPITITAADGAVLRPEGWSAFSLTEGDRVALGAPKTGVRSYVAVRGGFDVTPVLDSCSRDIMGDIGPAPVAVGDRLPILPLERGGVVGHAETPPCALPAMGDIVTLDVVLGPRTDWFTEAALERLQTQLWQVTPQSNRIGIRLMGEVPLERAITSELPSEGVVLGAIQVPASGQPVLFLADHPLTGGYPVIGAVAPYHLDLCGQIPINARVRFRPVTAFHETR